MHNWVIEFSFHFKTWSFAYSNSSTRKATEWGGVGGDEGVAESLEQIAVFKARSVLNAASGESIFLSA